MARTVNNDRDDYQKSLVELIGCRPVAYWPILARKIGGVKAAVLLSQLMYWNGDKNVQKRNGWFWKSVEELEEETGLTRMEQQTARDTLVDLGIIETILKGMPRIWHYKVNLETLTAVLIDPLNGSTLIHSMDQHSSSRSINGKVDQYSSGRRINIDRGTGGMFIHRVDQLNKESETTNRDYLTETTSSSYAGDSDDDSDLSTGGKEEEEANDKFSSELLSALNQIGVFENLIPEIESSGLDEDALFELIDQAKAKEPEPGKTAALFLYRLRNRPKTASPAAQTNKYTAALRKYGLED